MTSFDPKLIFIVVPAHTSALSHRILKTLGYLAEVKVIQLEPGMEARGQWMKVRSQIASHDLLSICNVSCAVLYTNHRNAGLIKSKDCSYRSLQVSQGD